MFQKKLTKIKMDKSVPREIYLSDRKARGLELNTSINDGGAGLMSGIPNDREYIIRRGFHEWLLAAIGGHTADTASEKRHKNSFTQGVPDLCFLYGLLRKNPYIPAA